MRKSLSTLLRFRRSSTAVPATRLRDYSFSSRLMIRSSIRSLYDEDSRGSLPSLSCARHQCSSFSTSSFSKDANRSTSEGEDTTSTPIETGDKGSTFIIPGTQKGGRKLAIVFTCTVCETRSAKQFTEQAYNHGVVIVRCPGCANLHLIADRLGYFEDGDWDLESIMAKAGQEKVKTITDDNVFEMTLEDLVGKDKMNELVASDLSSGSDQVQDDDRASSSTTSSSRKSSS